jgi:hypothetical protein
MRGMALKRGIIYGTHALFRRSSAYPNGRLIVLGMFLAVVLPWSLMLSTVTATDLALGSSQPRAFDAAVGYDGFVLAASLASMFSGLTLMTFAGVRIAVHRRQQAVVNPPASNPDNPAESD